MRFAVHFRAVFHIILYIVSFQQNNLQHINYIINRNISTSLCGRVDYFRTLLEVLTSVW